MYNINVISPDMKKTINSVFIGVTLLFTGQISAQAEECKSCSIDVSFTGIYNDETCEVVINDAGNTETITLPEMSTQTLKTPGTEAGSIAFRIGLKECPANRNIQLKFISSASDSATGNLLNTTGKEYSKNVQIRIRKNNGSQIKIGDLASSQSYFIPESGETITHEYIANYYASGSTGSTPGEVKTTAEIELIYQ